MKDTTKLGILSCGGFVFMTFAALLAQGLFVVYERYPVNMAPLGTLCFVLGVGGVVALAVGVIELVGRWIHD